MDADGIVAEVIFPNTIPPFFPTASLLAQPVPPSSAELDARWLGLQAHNRWLADFCGRLPGRRAGVAQIMLHDVEPPVAEAQRAKEARVTAGILLRGPHP